MAYENGTQSPMALNYLGGRWGMPAWGIFSVHALACTDCGVDILRGVQVLQKKHSCDFYHAVDLACSRGAQTDLILCELFLPCELKYYSSLYSFWFTAPPQFVQWLNKMYQYESSSVTPE